MKWFKQDSPKFYIIKGNTDIAFAVLQTITKPEGYQDLNTTPDLTLSGSKISVLDPNRDGRSFRSLKKPKYLRAFLVG